MRNIGLLIPIVLVICFCARNEVTLVEKTFDDGTEMTTKTYLIENQDSVLVKETYYYQDGTKRMEAIVSDTGTILWTFYYDNGQKNIEAKFEDDRRIGMWNVWDRNGNQINREFYTVETFEDGFPHVIRLFDMIDDEKERIYEIHFYENHSRRAEGPVKQGQKYGHWIGYYRDGMRWSEGDFRYEVNHGMSRVYHENGAVYYEGEYFFGERVGIWKFFREDSTLIKEIDYGKKKAEWSEDQE